MTLKMPNKNTPTPMAHDKEWIIPLMSDSTSKSNTNDIQPLMESPSIPTLAGNDTACNEQDTDCVVVTQSAVKRWSSIGYLFSMEKSLANARIYTDTGTCNTNRSGCDLATAQSQGIMYNQLWTYNGTAYESIKTTDSPLPWKTYWVALLQNADGQNRAFKMIGVGDNTNRIWVNGKRPEFKYRTSAIYWYWLNYITN